MTQPIFYFDKLNTWDKTTIFLYLLLSLGLWYCYDKSISGIENSAILFGYAFGTQLFIYLINYRSLRNLTVYFFWFLMGDLHLYIYFQLKEAAILQGVKADYAIVLRNTIILLVIFQVLRFISAKTQGRELVCPTRIGGPDLFGERPTTIIDSASYAIYVGAMILLSFTR